MYFSNGAVLSIHQKHFISIFFFCWPFALRLFFAYILWYSSMCFIPYFFSVFAIAICRDRVLVSFLFCFFPLCSFLLVLFFSSRRFVVLSLYYLAPLCSDDSEYSAVKLHYRNLCASATMRLSIEIASKTMIRLGLNVLGNWFTTTFCRLFLLDIFTGQKSRSKRSLQLRFVFCMK